MLTTEIERYFRIGASVPNPAYDHLQHSATDACLGNTENELSASPSRKKQGSKPTAFDNDLAPAAACPTARFDPALRDANGINSTQGRASMFDGDPLVPKRLKPDECNLVIKTTLFREVGLDDYTEDCIRVFHIGSLLSGQPAVLPKSVMPEAAQGLQPPEQTIYFDSQHSDRLGLKRKASFVADPIHQKGHRARKPSRLSSMHKSPAT